MATLNPIQITRVYMDYPRLDPKLGGRQRNLISFIRNQNLWISTLDGVETQLTFTGDNNGKSNGLAEFIVQVTIRNNNKKYVYMRLLIILFIGGV